MTPSPDARRPRALRGIPSSRNSNCVAIASVVPGSSTRMRVRPRDVKVDPKHGRGATRAEVISTASQAGFASESYKDVFTDYHGFAQSALDREELPAGQRRQIKRYFRLIQPRR